MLKQVLLSLVVIGGLNPLTASAQLSDQTAESANLVDEIELVNYTDLNERIDQLEAQIASFNARSASYRTASHSRATVSRTCCNTTCCNDAGWSLGIDFIFAKPHFSDGVNNGDPTYDFSFTPRFILAHENECGTGCRARYWWYEDDSSISSSSGSVDSGVQTQLRMDVADLEVTQNINHWRGIQPTLFAGLRYANLDHYEIQNGNDFVTANGWGPTLGIDTLTPLSCNCSLVANLRYAVLFGEASARDEQIEDFGANALEAQLGAQWQRCTKYGVMRYHTLFEVQNWESATQDPEDLDLEPDDDLVMLGLVFGVEFLR